MMHPDRPDGPQLHLPRVTTTAVLDFTTALPAEQRALACSAAHAPARSRVVVRIDNLGLWDLHPDVPTFLTDAAVERSLHLVFEGGLAACEAWADALRDGIARRLTSTP